jgi:hypothetical protein
MTTLTCPKCRLGMPDDALDAGLCPGCGFPLDGPLVLDTPGSAATTRWKIAAGLVVVLAGTGVAGYQGYQFLGRESADRSRETADRGRDPDSPAPPVAPLPHESKRRDSGSTPRTESTPGDHQGKDGGPVLPPGAAVDPPKGNAPRPVGVVMKVDPRVAAQRHFDHPDDTAAVSDLNTNDHVVLTGRVRTLRLGSVNGRGSVDASGLAAEEVIVTGDLNGEATVAIHAPDGRVRIGGYVGGSSKLTVRAPGGEVVLANSGRFTGGSAVAVTAKRLTALGVLGGGSRVDVTITAGGSLKVTRAEEGATVRYKKAAAADPAPVIETGELRGGATVSPQ